MSNDIKKMLRITDKNLVIDDVSYETVHKQNTLVIHATLSPAPCTCIHCGSSTHNSRGETLIVKNGKKSVTVKFEQYNLMPTIMKLKKQRYTCKNCSVSWTAQSYFVRPKQSISSQVKFKIIALFKEKISLSFIAKLTNISITTVIRILKELKSYLPNTRKTTLPRVLMVDEFRSHARTEDKMSFICADGETGQLIDVLPSRKLSKLTTHFKQFSTTESVEFLVTDMNAAYFQLLKHVFPNAQLIVDRFHIIKHLNTAFQDFRIREMKRLKQENQLEAYRKIKANWRFFTKNRRNINHSEYKTWRSFRSPKYPYLTEAMMIDRLLDYSTTLKEAYVSFHNLTDAFRTKDHDEFFTRLKELPTTLDEEFRKKLQTLFKFEDGIRNAMIYPYSNGKIEAKNTHIKTLKRISYGFKSFENMKIRIFLINGLIEIT